MNEVMRRSACCLLSALLLCSCVGCANSVHEISEGDAAQSSSKNDDAAEQAYKAFTVDALDRIAADDLNNSDKLVLVNKLGAKSVHGDDAIPFAKKVDENNMYYVVSMCKQKEQAPYSLVLYKDGQPHTVTTRESCTSNGVETVSLPAKNFPSATSLSIIKILTLRLCLVPKLDIISLSLTKAAYSWQVLYLKIGFRLVGHTL